MTFPSLPMWNMAKSHGFHLFLGELILTSCLLYIIMSLTVPLTFPLTLTFQLYPTIYHMKNAPLSHTPHFAIPILNVSARWSLGRKKDPPWQRQGGPSTKPWENCHLVCLFTHGCLVVYLPIYLPIYCHLVCLFIYPFSLFTHKKMWSIVVCMFTRG